MAKKFEWMPFYIDSGISIDGNTLIAVNLSDAYCYYGFGCNGEGERLRYYWIVFEPTKNSFPVAVFSTPENLQTT